MRITGSLPYHVARAYGVTPPASPAAPLRPAAPSSTLFTRPTDATALALRQLVAARTTAPIEFDGSSAPATAGAAFPFYARAADRIEAAVAVQVGRAIDVTG